MIEGNRLADHMHHGITTAAGMVAMVADSGLLSWVGAAIGIGGLACSISREVRGVLFWLDRRHRRRQRRKGV